MHKYLCKMVSSGAAWKAVLCSCPAYQELLHKILLPQLFPTSGKLFLAYRSSEFLPGPTLAQLLGRGEIRGHPLPLFTIFPPKTSFEVFPPAPLCSDTKLRQYRKIAIYLLFQLPGHKYSAWLRLVELLYREVLIHKRVHLSQCIYFHVFSVLSILFVWFGFCL